MPSTTIAWYNVPYDAEERWRRSISYERCCGDAAVYTVAETRMDWYQKYRDILLAISSLEFATRLSSFFSGKVLLINAFWNCVHQQLLFAPKNKQYAIALV